MSHEAQEADANLIEIARLRAELEQAQADIAAYRRIIDVLSRAGDIASVRGVASAALVQFRPGAQILTELEAARAVVEAARCVVTHKNRNECARIDNALYDYDEVLKAGGE